MNQPRQHGYIHAHPCFGRSQRIFRINRVFGFIYTGNVRFRVGVATFFRTSGIVRIFGEQRIPVGTDGFETGDMDMVDVIAENRRIIPVGNVIRIHPCVINNFTAFVFGDGLAETP